MRSLRSRWKDLEGAIDLFDPQAEDWSEASGALGARVDSFDRQLDVELGALQRQR